MIDSQNVKGISVEFVRTIQSSMKPPKLYDKKYDREDL